MKQGMNDAITAYCTSVKKSLHWHVTKVILFNAKVGIFPPSYAIVPSFISSFTTFYHLDACFIVI